MKKSECITSVFVDAHHVFTLESSLSQSRVFTDWNRTTRSALIPHLQSLTCGVCCFIREYDFTRSSVLWTLRFSRRWIDGVFGMWFLVVPDRYLRFEGTYHLKLHGLKMEADISPKRWYLYQTRRGHILENRNLHTYTYLLNNKWGSYRNKRHQIHCYLRVSICFVVLSYCTRQTFAKIPPAAYRLGQTTLHFRVPTT